MEMDLDLLTMIISLIGMVTGIVGLIVSVLVFFNNKSQMVDRFADHSVNSQLIDARRFVYNLPDESVITNDSPLEEQRYVAEIVNFYDHWGLMIKRKQFPLWAFYSKKDGLTAAGVSVIRLYGKLIRTIEARRKQNEKYAYYFQQLYDLLKK